MDCKFLDSYQADLDGNSIDVWYCRKRDPFVLGPSREVALRTCSGCRLSDHTRPPSELAYEVERRNQELVALNAIVSAVNSSLDLSTVLNTGLDKAIEILQVDAGWVALAAGEELHLALHRGVSDELRARHLDPRRPGGRRGPGRPRAADGGGRRRLGQARRCHWPAPRGSRPSSPPRSRRKAGCSA